jgi:hypothetical protein
MNRFVLGCEALLFGALLGCNARVGEGAALGGETHFLVTCGEGCGPSLSCIGGVCTRSCEPGFSSCSELATTAACVAPNTSGASTPFSGTCDSLCDVASDCAGLGTGYACVSGACRAEPEARQAAFAAALSRGPALVSAVDADTCQAGLRWEGGDHASAEMRPGSDCVGCHRETGARPLLLGGTVYSDGGFETNQPLDGCFGLEGVEVVVTDGDEFNGFRERTTVTNRAGNFYFEGDEDPDFDPSYQVTIVWNKQGREHRNSMAVAPAYGGCARCHAANAVDYYPPPDVFLDPETVSPAGSVIFTAGLYDRP